MKFIFNKKGIKRLLLILVSLFLFHLPLMIKDIITADVLLINSYYEGYSWEISLGRFGTFMVGILKSYISTPHLDLLLSYIFLALAIQVILELFDIKDKYLNILCIAYFIISPVISATLLFQQCNIVYSLAFLLGACSVYLFYNTKNKYLRILVPIIFIIASLSFYQAYLSLIVTVFVLFNIRQLLDKKIDYKKCEIFCLILLVSIFSYFIIMKASQYLLHIDMANYSNANNIGVNTILSIPHKVIDAYRLFYQFYFSNAILKNSYFHNDILNLILLLLFGFVILSFIVKCKISRKEKLLVILLILLIPVFLNSVIFVISDAKLQLLMSAAYLIVPFFFLSIDTNKYVKVAIVIVLSVLLRNYIIQDQATYTSLNSTFLEYKTIIGTAINDNINSLDKEFVLYGDLDITRNSLTKHFYERNYGYIADSGIFWKEHSLRKLGFERFVEEYFGLEVKYVDIDTYTAITDKRNSNDIICEVDNVIVIDLDNYNRVKND